MSVTLDQIEGDKNKMRQSTSIQWWIFIFVAMLIMTCIAALRLAQGQGSLPALMGYLSSDTLLVAHIFKRAVLHAIKSLSPSFFS